MSDCRSSYRAATLLHGQPSFCRQYSFASVLRARQSTRLAKVSEIKHIYEVRPRKDRRGVDLTSYALPFGRLWYGERDAISNAIGYTKVLSRSQGSCDSRLR
jgi:hypothetical protein